jgi:hypothetical protein
MIKKLKIFAAAMLATGATVAVANAQTNIDIVQPVSVSLTTDYVAPLKVGTTVKSSTTAITTKDLVSILESAEGLSGLVSPYLGYVTVSNAPEITVTNVIPTNIFVAGSTNIVPVSTNAVTSFGTVTNTVALSTNAVTIGTLTNVAGAITGAAINPLTYGNTNGTLINTVTYSGTNVIITNETATSTNVTTITESNVGSTNVSGGTLSSVGTNVVITATSTNWTTNVTTIATNGLETITVTGSFTGDGVTVATNSVTYVLNAVIPANFSTMIEGGTLVIGTVTNSFAPATNILTQVANTVTTSLVTNNVPVLDSFTNDLSTTNFVTNISQVTATNFVNVTNIVAFTNVFTNIITSNITATFTNVVSVTNAVFSNVVTTNFTNMPFLDIVTASTNVTITNIVTNTGATFTNVVTNVETFTNTFTYTNFVFDQTVAPGTNSVTISNGLILSDSTTDTNAVAVTNVVTYTNVLTYADVVTDTNGDITNVATITNLETYTNGVVSGEVTNVATNVNLLTVITNVTVTNVDLITNIEAFTNVLAFTNVANTGTTVPVTNTVTNVIVTDITNGFIDTNTLVITTNIGTNASGVALTQAIGTSAVSFATSGNSNTVSLGGTVIFTSVGPYTNVGATNFSVSIGGNVVDTNGVVAGGSLASTNSDAPISTSLDTTITTVYTTNTTGVGTNVVYITNLIVTSVAIAETNGTSTAAFITNFETNIVLGTNIPTNLITVTVGEPGHFVIVSGNGKSTKYATNSVTNLTVQTITSPGFDQGENDSITETDYSVKVLTLTTPALNLTMYGSVKSTLDNFKVVAANVKKGVNLVEVPVTNQTWTVVGYGGDTAVNAVAGDTNIVVTGTITIGAPKNVNIP